MFISLSTRCVVGSSRSQSSSRCVIPTIWRNSTLPFGVSMPPSTGSGAKATPTSFVTVLRRRGELVGIKMISPEPFFAVVDVFGEILHKRYRPKRLAWDYIAATRL